MRNETYGFTEYEVKIKNTGYPMDGHRAIVELWDYNPGGYSLRSWLKEDDEIFEKSMYKSLEDAGMLTADSFEEFHDTWSDGSWCPDGIFCLTEDQVEIIKETEK